MSAQWDDLTTRTASAVVMAVVALVMVALGGAWFQMLAVFATAVMIWELWMMIHPEKPESGMMMAALSASAFSGLLVQDSWIVLLFFLITPVIGSLLARTEKPLFFVYALGIQIAGWGLIEFRGSFGMTWLLWVILVVIMTDVAGYFAGRSFGGPKFWPAISPKKTWSGTIAGWLGGALIGAVFVLLTDAGPIVILLSMILSFASQMGDIAESALKRRVGVKDSSDLIPGHGGLCDRFDGLLGAVLFMLVVTMGLNLPGAVF